MITRLYCVSNKIEVGKTENVKKPRDLRRHRPSQTFPSRAATYPSTARHL
jgi:hypothetical protein